MESCTAHPIQWFLRESLFCGQWWLICVMRFSNAVLFLFVPRHILRANHDQSMQFVLSMQFVVFKKNLTYNFVPRLTVCTKLFYCVEWLLYCHMVGSSTCRRGCLSEPQKSLNSKMSHNLKKVDHPCHSKHSNAKTNYSTIFLITTHKYPWN